MAALGPAELKNIELPVVVHRVVLPWEEASSAGPEAAHIHKADSRKWKPARASRPRRRG
jgi:hypothetical protein